MIKLLPCYTFSTLSNLTRWELHTLIIYLFIYFFISCLQVKCYSLELSFIWWFLVLFLGFWGWKWKVDLIFVCLPSQENKIIKQLSFHAVHVLGVFFGVGQGFGISDLSSCILTFIYKIRKEWWWCGCFNAFYHLDTYTLCKFNCLRYAPPIPGTDPRPFRFYPKFHTHHITLQISFMPFLQWKILSSVHLHYSFCNCSHIWSSSTSACCQ